jgi:hypothetical protein
MLSSLCDVAPQSRFPNKSPHEFRDGDFKTVIPFMGYNVQAEHRQSSGTCRSLTGLLDAAMDIASKRRDALREMRGALVKGDNEAALQYARRLCGLNDEACS